MSIARRSAAWVVLALSGVVTAPAQLDRTDWKVEQTRTTREAAGVVEVRIANPWGNVTLRAGESDQIVVSAIIQRHRDDPREAELRVEETSSGLAFEPRFDDSLEIQDRADWRARRIDLGVAVPQTLPVTIRTGDSDIAVQGLSARADLETTAGDIEFRGEGGLRARTDSGSIFAQFRRSDWPRPGAIETRTGGIRAELLEGASATVELETRGPITSDYSTTIERAAGSHLKRGVATVGAGGQTLRLTSYNGAIRLLAVIVPERSREKEASK